MTKVGTYALTALLKKDKRFNSTFQDGHTYNKLFDVLGDLNVFSHGAPATVFMDFEKALMNAVTSHMPWVEVCICIHLESSCSSCYVLRFFKGLGQCFKLVRGMGQKINPLPHGGILYPIPRRPMETPPPPFTGRV